MFEHDARADVSENGGSQKERREGRGLGPFRSGHLTIIIVVVVVAVAIPLAAGAVVGSFTSTTATPAVTATNSASVANATGVQGTASATTPIFTRFGVSGTASGTGGIGVFGTGRKWGVYSNGPLGVAAGKSLVCTACVGPAALTSTVKKGDLLYSKNFPFTGPYTAAGKVISTQALPAGLACMTASASAIGVGTPPFLVDVRFALQDANTFLKVAAQDLQLSANEALSHKALIGPGTQCVTIPATRYDLFVVDGNTHTASNMFDFASATLQVFSQ
jgi:hypothetical protein